jgi:hypothetical protein
MPTRRAMLRALACATASVMGCGGSGSPAAPKVDEAEDSNRRSAEAILKHQQSQRHGGKAKPKS